MSLPYALMPVCRQQFCDENGDPYAGGTLYYYTAGSSTPKGVYADANGSVSLGTSVTLDAGGYAPALFFDRGGYKVVLKDADGAEVWTVDGAEDVATTFFDELGTELSDGARDVASGYIVLSTDRFITVASTGGPNPCLITLPAATDHTMPIGIKNMGTVALGVYPTGGDTIDGINDKYTVPAAATPLFPCVWLVSDGSSAWFIVASHGIA